LAKLPKQQSSSSPPLDARHRVNRTPSQEAVHFTPLRIALSASAYTSGVAVVELLRFVDVATRVADRRCNCRHQSGTIRTGHFRDIFIHFLDLCLGDRALPPARSRFVDRATLAIDGDDDRHVLDQEFVDRLHAEVLVGDNPR
jgi:hypothetical protein